MSFLVNSFVYGSGAVPLDPDAVAFLTAAAITDPTQQSAVNQLVVDLKGYGVWTKMKALYPFIGGTASQHKFNLKNPLDTDAAFRLVFFGGVTHDSNGITGNGTNGYFNTFVNPSINLQLNNTSIWAYSRTQLARNGDGFLFNDTFTTTNGIQLMPRISDNTATTRINSTSIAVISNSNSQGFFGASRTNSSDVDYWIRGVKTNISLLSSGLINTTILGYFFRSAGVFSQRNMCFSAIGDGLTDTEASNFYTAVQTFNTTLNRQIP